MDGYTGRPTRAEVVRGLVALVVVLLSFALVGTIEYQDAVREQARVERVARSEGAPR